MMHTSVMERQRVAVVAHCPLYSSTAVLVGYSAAFYFLSLTLDTIPIGVAYAVWSGVGVATITLVSFVVYDQKIDAAGLLGIGLIVAGVVVLRLFSEASVDACRVVNATVRPRTDYERVTREEV